MGLLEDAYKWIDRNIAGGLLPGGETSIGLPLAGAVERVAGQFAPGPQLPSGYRPPAAPAAPVSPAGALFGTSAVGMAANGMPVVAPRPMAMPRGKTVTGVATIYPDGTVVPGKLVPGRPVVTTEDLRTVKRVKKAKRLLDRAFPKPKAKRRSYRAPRTRTVYVEKKK